MCNFLLLESDLVPRQLDCDCEQTRNQGSLVLKKIEQELVPRSPLLRSEIKDITINQSVAKITFRNDSVIEVVTAADTARGGRASLLIIDEYRMVDKEVLDLV